MNTEKDFLGKEPVGKLLVKLAFPTVAAQLINMLYNIIDRMYIGHIPKTGALALTGVGVCMPLIMIVSAFAALVGYGGSPRASICMGKKKPEEAEKILGNCFSLQVIISVLLTTALLLWNRKLLLAFGASPNTIEYAVSYMNIYAVGTVFVQLTLGMNAFITAQGFAKTGMFSVLIGAVTNIVLDPIFIFGFGMGVRGAALATILSQALSCIWVLHFLFGKKTVLKIKKQNLRLKKKVILPCLALGVSTFIMQASESIISVCFNSSLLKYGGDIAVGAMTILTSVMQFAMLPLQGLGQGAQPIISYNYGARNKDRVKAAFTLLLKVSMCYAGILWLCVMLFPQGFAAMFTSDMALLEFTKTALRIYMAVMVLFGIQVACQMTFNALGKAKESIVVAVMRKFVLLLPLIYIMPAVWKANPTFAVYMAEPIADTIAVTFTAILFAARFKKALSAI
ncbi:MULTISPECIES: MATE family efflux transporter [Lachnospiraceae]|uniref:Multidrug export protein MepA n=1 Tax=Faecalicatena acetigenes TaxID=2981790 RepID=A0ABT2T8H9_9FIRM|nr:MULTISPECIES: MATE family efflux transporter [Lachnospiraceae]MCU6746527.1 MATE family efflux transporter [Faecalicatena acetigenes]RGT73518.1 MATE family efflux transporter [Ruminococcus sp. AF18-22]SCH22983.1 Staphylococcal virulence regulator protein A [uncultured Clostridium sp.]